MGKFRKSGEQDLDVRRENSDPVQINNSRVTRVQLDFDTMMRASRALSSEIVPSTLIDALMRIALEYSGAQRGVLIRLREGTSTISARMTAARCNIRVVQQPYLVSSQHLSETILCLALRTKKPLILDDALNQSPCSRDGYVRRVRPRSVLCLPIVQASRQIGALYLENKLTPGVFTQEHVAVLTFLATQAVISLENADICSELKRSEAFLANGQELSNTGSWSLDLATGSLFWSENNYRIFGLDPYSGPPPNLEQFTKLIHLDDLEQWLGTNQPAFQAGIGFTHEFRVVLNNGVIKHIQSVGRPVFDARGKVTSYIGTVLDITERKRREDALRDAQSELARATRATTMGELATSIAHEVNQPLAATVTNAEACLLLLSKHPPNLERVRKATERIVRDGRQAGDIIRNIRATLKRSEAIPKRLAINAVVNESINLVLSELRKDAISLELHLSQGLDLIVGDRVQLQQLVVNLIKNGIEAMAGIGDRPRTIRVTTCTAPEGGVEVRIADTGIGLDGIGVSRIFEPLFTTKATGLGMGLSICRSIVESHHGRIQVSAQAPHGTIFSIVIPAGSGRRADS